MMTMSVLWIISRNETILQKKRELEWSDVEILVDFISHTLKNQIEVLRATKNIDEKVALMALANVIHKSVH